MMCVRQLEEENNCVVHILYFCSKSMKVLLSAFSRICLRFVNMVIKVLKKSVVNYNMGDTFSINNV